MTDILASGINHGRTRRVDTSSDAARARIRARYRAETRFKSYGIIALLITGVFLAALMFNIFQNGLPAFWQHSLKLDVNVTAEDIDPSGKRDPKQLQGGDYFAVVRKALEAQFPGDRKSTRLNSSHQ